MKRTLLGMLTPSSNTVLEPVTCDMLRQIPEASAHFGRFAVTRIGLHSDGLAQFDTPEVLQAATRSGSRGGKARRHCNPLHQPARCTAGLRSGGSVRSADL